MRPLTETEAEPSHAEQRIAMRRERSDMTEQERPGSRASATSDGGGRVEMPTRARSAIGATPKPKVRRKALIVLGITCTWVW